MLIPVIAAPFLTESGDVESMKDDTDVKETFNDDTQLIYPYSIVSLFLLINSIYSIVIWYLYPVTEEHPSRIRAGATEENNTNKGVNSGFYKVLLILMAAAFMHIYYGLQISFGSFLPTFTVKSTSARLANQNITNIDTAIHDAKIEGAYLCTLFWLACTLIRIPAVFVLNRLAHDKSILISLGIILVSNIILVPFGNEYTISLWIGVPLIGIGMSVIWGCMFGFLEYFFPISSFIGSRIIMSAIVGEFVFPVIISSFISQTPQILLWVVLFCSCTITIIFLLMMLISKSKMQVIGAKYGRGLSMTPSLH